MFGGATFARERADLRPTRIAGVASFGRAKRCILVYLLGGPPQIDMWDLKPEAPAEIRGPFKPIASAVPGMQFCEHLPRLAAAPATWRCCNSVTFPNNDHPAMIYHTLTGRDRACRWGQHRIAAFAKRRSAHGFGRREVSASQASVPGYVAIPEVRVRMQARRCRAEAGPAFWARRTTPWRSTRIPTSRSPGSSFPRGFQSGGSPRGKSLLAMLDGHAPRTAARATTRRFASRPRAWSASAGGRHVRTRARASPQRDRYGRHRFGQSLLLGPAAGRARSVVRRRALQLHDEVRRLGHPQEQLRRSRTSCCRCSTRAVGPGRRSAQRGMLDETLVVVMGEFGRTPQINADGGRDHWGH